MTSEHVETVVIGAGQAGLATAYHLRQRGRPVLVLDGNARVGDNWRQHWDSLKLYTPAHVDGLPGLRFPGNRWTFPGKDDVADYLEDYTACHELPVRLGTRVHYLRADGEGGYVLTTDTATITCDNVVVATGTFGRTPNIPDFAAQLDPAIAQLHSSAYRRPSQLPDGPVLVVGASHSGCDIAYELAATHETILCGRDCGQLPFRPESPKARLAFPLVLFAWRHVLTRRTPVGRRLMGAVRRHGGPMLRVHRCDLAARGVRRITERVTGVRGGLPELADGSTVDVRTVVWCTGFRQVFDWIELPILQDDGWPAERRGVVASHPGLYFCGLSFQYAFSSMVLPGVGRDAQYVAEQIASRARTAARAVQRAAVA
jgi:putative flavoprotein involved in K+ transport